ncbi:hypothetical protein N7447_001609 [Penicillium robsamsonii]|uniref:uncharacterized protein n=1 Tax=Penicillium robsamsonii TaxID=1792511 RepID=UPI0025492328|nr:uncharacterized protein N7447_001609 [Penicillium robsamsonii]KAJ5835583.1 hypothetical protein N7447_001609 [Penicillium robsamsonii]
MIDENLPTFFLKNNSKQPQISTIYHRQHGNDPEPAYSLRALDSTAPASQNRYGVALYDPYVTDVVYGEVAVAPDWTQPSLSADTIRANGGVVPPPEPILPTEFTIQLYNPDQEITVKYHTKSWNKPARWEFEMPQNTFRVPSTSVLDQTQIDPSLADVTPKLRFSWRKDGKLSKDLTCLLHGKTSTIAETRTKNREPDITVALFQGLKELTLYEPNLSRVEMEDTKGLEVVLLLAAVAIRDIFFGPAKEAFHITPGGPSQARKPVVGSNATAVTTTQAGDPRRDRRNSQARPPGAEMSRKSSMPRLSIPSSSSPAPQERRRQDELARQEEERRTQEVLAAEQKARRRREAEVEKETKRLQQLYGKEEEQARMQRHTPAPSSRPYLPPRHTGPGQPYSHQYSQSSVQLSSQPEGRPSHPPRQQHSHGVPNGPYLHAPGRMDPRAQSSTHLMQSRPQQPRPQPRPQSTVGFHQQPTGSGALPVASRPTPQVQPKKSSFFGFRRSKEESAATKLEKKRSSMV